MTRLEIIGQCGRLRAGSFNRMALEFAVTVMPDGIALDIVEIRPVPPFGADVLAPDFTSPLSSTE